MPRLSPSHAARRGVRLASAVAALVGACLVLAPSPAPPFYAPDYRPTGHAHRRMFATEATQRAIWAHQNPASCDDATFMALAPQLSGTGSTVHIIGAYLALALNLGHVLYLVNGSLDNWGRAECGARTGHECFFQPLTRCVVTELSRVVQPPTADVVNVMPVALSSTGADGVVRLPAQAPTWLPDTPDLQIKYWWRAQASAYIMRLNAQTSAALRKRRMWRPPDWAVHIRRGAKHTEMKLYPPDKFLRAVPAPAARVLVVTEDAPTMRLCEDALGSRLRRVERLRTNVDSVQWPLADMLDFFTELWLSLEATHFVGSLGSNWARLTDELRRVWAAPARGCCTPYIEVGCEAETCEVNTHNW